MSSEASVKTTVRIPADLHWQFQVERTKRRLSNEAAIQQAFATWIESPATRKRKTVSVQPSDILDPIERLLVQGLRDVLRSGDQASITTLTAVVQALSNVNFDLPAFLATGDCRPEEFEKGMERQPQSTGQTSESAKIPTTRTKRNKNKRLSRKSVPPG
jgi:hypothetical protein